MLSERARRYLASLQRLAPVPTAEVERALRRQGLQCYPAWLDFHERYAGYVEPIGLEAAVLGIVHAQSRWMVPGAVATVDSYQSEADYFVVCADVHPSYEYYLGDTGFFRSPWASTFEVKLERSAARVDFHQRTGAGTWVEWPVPPALVEEMRRDAREVPEGSDEHFRLLVGERFFALQETGTGRLVDFATCR
jgi:hypothetical protein